MTSNKSSAPVYRPGWAQLVSFLLVPAAGLLLWNRLPAQLPIHYGINGMPDQWAARWIVLLVVPACFFLFDLAFFWLLNHGPAKKDLPAIPSAVMGIVSWLIPGVCALVGLLAIASGLGFPLNAGDWICFFVGFVLIPLGNLLPKATPNGVFGFRVPWIYDKRVAWAKTQRFAGWVLILGGFAMIFSSLLNCPLAGLATMLAGALVCLLVSVYFATQEKKAA